MSKDKHRPSTAEHEVTKSDRDFRRLSGPAGVAGVYSTTPAPTPPVPDSDWAPDDNLMDEYRENWYPQGLRVVNQLIHYDDREGRMRVNVTFQWDALEGADIYFIRVAPESAGPQPQIGGS